MERLLKLKELILDILFPPICLVCEKALRKAGKEEYICSSCFNSIPINATLYCSVCRARLADNKKVCHKKDSYLLGAAATYDDEKVKKLIWRLKYKKERCAAKPLAKILLAYIGPIKPISPASIIIPIPLHFSREKERGFNQSKAIAEEINKAIGAKLMAGNLIRIKNTKPQPEMKGLEKRLENITGCFAVKNPELIKDRSVILIDDVFTSGSTMNEAVKILREVGTKRITALVVAKV